MGFPVLQGTGNLGTVVIENLNAGDQKQELFNQNGKNLKRKISQPQTQNKTLITSQNWVSWLIAETWCEQYKPRQKPENSCLDFSLDQITIVFFNKFWLLLIFLVELWSSVGRRVRKLLMWDRERWFWWLFVWTFPYSDSLTYTSSLKGFLLPRLVGGALLPSAGQSEWCCCQRPERPGSWEWVWGMCFWIVGTWAVAMTHNERIVTMDVGAGGCSKPN